MLPINLAYKTKQQQKTHTKRTTPETIKVYIYNSHFYKQNYMYLNVLSKQK